MVTMAWRSLRSRWAAAAASVLAVMLGAALSVAALSIGASAASQDAGVAQRQWQLRDADAVVRRDGSIKTGTGLAMSLNEQPRLSAGDLTAIRGVPGVRSVSAEASFPVYVLAPEPAADDGPVRSWGHSWLTAVADPVRLTAGTAPARDDDLVVDAVVARDRGLTVGGRVRVLTTQGIREFRLAGIVARAGEQAEQAVFLTPAAARELGGPPMTALITTTGGASLPAVARAVEAAVPGARVLTGAAKGRAVTADPERAGMAGGMGQFIGTMSGCALLITVLVISSMLSISVAQRRRELAMLLAVGATPGRVRTLILGEAALIGVLGGALGAVLGAGLAAAGLRLFIRAGLMPEGLPLVLDGWSLLAGVGIATVTAVAAGAVPAWRAARLAPSQALRVVDEQPRRIGRVRRVLGVCSLALALIMLAAALVLHAPVNSLSGAIAISLGFTAAPFLVLAAGLLGPLILGGLLRLAGPVLRRGFGGFMAARGIQADLRRAVSLATPLMLMVGVACLLLFQDWATFAGKTRNYAERLSAELVVAGPHMVGVPSVLQARAERIPGVAAASGTVSSWVYVEGSGSSAPPNMEAMGIQPSAVAGVLDLPVAQGEWGRFTDAGIAVSTYTAADRNWKLGQRVSYLLPDGSPAEATVDVVYRSDSTFAGVLVPRSVLLPHLHEQFDTAVYVKLRPDADRAAVQAELSRAVASMPGIQVQDRAAHLRTLAAQSSGDNWIVYLFVLLIAGYAGVGAINVLVGATVGQGRAFALLRLAGAQTRHVLAWVSVEALFAVLAGILQGTAIAAVVLLSYGYLLTDGFWLPFPPGQYLLICGVALLVGLVGVLAPARLAMRARPLEANATG